MKAFWILVVLGAVAFFVGGGIATWQGALDVHTYALIGGIVGSVASSIGLIAFALPRLTDKDMMSLESQLVQRLAETTASLNDYESRLSDNKEELEQLQRDRLEIELLVRQASIKVFLEEKMRRLTEEIEDHVASDKTLVTWLAEYQKTRKSIGEIEGKITESDRAELIREVIGELAPSRRKVFVHIGGQPVDVSPVLRVSEQLVATVVDSFTGSRR